MMDAEEQSVSHSGAKQSFVQYFGIEGLFGYRSVSLGSDFAATILIAKNGSGKTTLLGALDAFLKCQFGRLSELAFSRIECRLQGIDETLILFKSDIDDALKFSQTAELIRFAKVNELDLNGLLFFVLWEYPSIKTQDSALREHPIFYKVYAPAAQTMETAKAAFNGLEAAIRIPLSPLDILRTQITSALSDIEVVYLPTYRRIELSLPESEDSNKWRPSSMPSIQTRLGISRRSLHAGDIQFGLADIAERLRRLNQEMLFESNQQYREISANIIDDLISGAFEVPRPTLEHPPSQEALAVFFERLKSGRRNIYGIGGYADLQVPDLDRIYSGNIPVNSEKFLTYFLGKLNTVMQKTRDTEDVVEEFVKNCNRYLAADDPSAEVDGYEPRQIYDDEKILKLNRASLAVSVWSTRRNLEIPLDALSSGEKQMISLFARLYLYPKEKIVLIDEPELSLSIDWQRKILPDIVTAKLCKQVIAITHSPFVFDNELDAFAIPLRQSIDLTSPTASAEAGQEGSSHA